MHLSNAIAVATAVFATTAAPNPVKFHKSYIFRDQAEITGACHGHLWNMTDYNCLEPRYVRQRVTQWDAPGCGQGHHHIKEDKRGLSGECFRCVDIDPRTQSFDFALGWAPSLNAYSRSCSELALPFGGSEEFDLLNPKIGHPEYIIQTNIKGEGTCVDPASGGERDERIKAAGIYIPPSPASSPSRGNRPLCNSLVALHPWRSSSKNAPKKQ
ncbi:MAG: hypothetical protein Q9167_007439 [Letrouitia subvulpina]